MGFCGQRGIPDKAQLNHRYSGKKLKGIRPMEGQIQRNVKTCQLPKSCSLPHRKRQRRALGNLCFPEAGSLSHQKPQLKIQFSVPEPNLLTPKLCLFCRKASCLPRIPFSLNLSQSSLGFNQDAQIMTRFGSVSAVESTGVR